MPFTEVRVLIVGDNPLVRAGLAALLQDQPGIVVVGQVAGAELASLVDVFRADVLIWGVGWDVGAAFEQLAALDEHAPPVLLLLNDENRAAEALAAGARGLLLQDADAEILAVALSGLARGLVVLHPDLLPGGLPPVSASEPPLPPVDLLTPRELEVLALLAEGLPNKIIAARLNISEHTVKFHVNALMNKLGVQSRTEAVVRATRLGLIVL